MIHADTEEEGKRSSSNIKVKDQGQRSHRIPDG